MDDRSILGAVQDQYGATARSARSNDSAAVRAVARAFGYTEEDLASLPPQANMGLSCGNPTAVAGLRPGEIVVDLGCGGGLDVLLASKRVGPTGRAIGIDMTPDMLSRARAGAERAGATNVELHLAQIDDLPLPDASVDCVISNCVINLAPDKRKVFREIHRVLKPGGRVAISDIALRKPLPPEVAASVQAYVGCIAGALLLSEYESLLREAGLGAVVVSETGADLNVYAQAGGTACCAPSEAKDACCAPSEAEDAGTTSTSCCAPASDESCCAPPQDDSLARAWARFDANAFAASVRVHAVKPG